MWLNALDGHVEPLKCGFNFGSGRDLSRIATRADANQDTTDGKDPGGAHHPTIDARATGANNPRSVADFSGSFVEGE